MSRSSRGRRFPGRRLHLLDVENLLGCPRPILADVRACASSYATAVGSTPTDQSIVACNHGAAPAVAFGWPTARLLLRSGHDGADLALLQVLEHERVAERFPEVVVGSGDGIFADVVARLASGGVKVTVVSRASSLSRKLELAAPSIIFLDHGRPEAPLSLGFRVA
jgi:hypothetical protein